MFNASISKDEHPLDLLLDDSNPDTLVTGSEATA
jgi:hypothetical protein